MGQRAPLGNVLVATDLSAAAAHVLIGSVAEAVIRHARCDVLVASAAGPTFELP